MKGYVVLEVKKDHSLHTCSLTGHCGVTRCVVCKTQGRCLSWPIVVSPSGAMCSVVCKVKDQRAHQLLLMSKTEKGLFDFLSVRYHYPQEVGLLSFSPKINLKMK